MKFLARQDFAMLVLLAVQLDALRQKIWTVPGLRKSQTLVWDSTISRGAHILWDHSRAVSL